MFKMYYRQITGIGLFWLKKKSNTFIDIFMKQINLMQ